MTVNAKPPTTTDKPTDTKDKPGDTKGKLADTKGKPGTTNAAPNNGRRSSENIKLALATDATDYEAKIMKWDTSPTKPTTKTG